MSRRHLKFTIPARFWRTVSRARFGEMSEDSLLNKEECARLWRMLDRQDQPPDSLEIRLSEAEYVSPTVSQNNPTSQG